VERLLRSPLLRFLALGAVLYLGVLWLGPDREPGSASGLGATGSSGRAPDREIRVERDALLAFVQTRTQQPSAAATATAFDALGEEARQLWIDRFVREEALVREARSLGLDRDDELIRRRLVQKMEFLTEGAVRGGQTVSEDEIAAYYRAQAQALRVPASVTFAHVFVRGHGPEARARATTLQASLEEQGLGFTEALSLGDRFLYNRHYVDRTLEEIRSHFGEEMAAELVRLEPDPSRWRGPIESQHGWHLVLLTEREESRVPPLAEVSERLRADLARDRAERALDDALRAVVSRYRVDLDPELAADPSSAPGPAPGDGASPSSRGGETG